MIQTTRRLFLGLLAGGFSWLRGAGRAPTPEPGLRPYRIDATILFFSIPLFSRAGVGRGYARHNVAQESALARHTLEFAAASQPGRARGLNRRGMIRETVAETSTGVLEAQYFGFMTASREESLSEAKKALARAPAQSLFVAIQGESRPGQVRSVSAQFVAGGEEWQTLREQAEAAFRDPKQSGGAYAFRPEQPGAAPPTFLFSLLQAMRSSEQKTRSVYVYGRDRYELATSKKPDERMGRRLATKRPLVRLNGQIRNLRTGAETDFRLWVEPDGDYVPLRIEYQPRSFLRLALESE